MSQQIAIREPAAPLEAPAWLVHQWTLAGVVSASMTFLPVPFLDDYLRMRCRRFAVARTLEAHGAAGALDDLEPFYGDPGGLLSGLGGMALKVPLKLLLYPVWKPIKLIRSVRDVPLEIARTVLLARTLDRVLRRGESFTITGGARSIDRAEATRLRRTFDRTFARMDFRVLWAASKDAFALTSRLRSATLAVASDRSKSNDNLLEDLKADPAIDAEAERIQNAMDRPEILRLFGDFDERFDRALAAMPVVGR